MHAIAIPVNFRHPLHAARLTFVLTTASVLVIGAVSLMWASAALGLISRTPQTSGAGNVDLSSTSGFAYLPDLVTNVASCSDTDGVNLNIRSSITTVSKDGTVAVVQDGCYDSERVIERTCNGKNASAVIVPCANGCLGGRCRSADDRGVVYVVSAIDTETTPYTNFGSRRESTLDMRDYEPGGAVDQSMQPSYRAATADSDGKPVVISWFQLAMQMYCQSNLHNCTAVHTNMAKFTEKTSQWGDELGWHYHHAEWLGYQAGGDWTRYSWSQFINFNDNPTTNGSGQKIAERMVAAQILDQHTYPSVYRAGWDWEDTALSNWLDNVLPYDYSNFAPYNSPAAANGPYGNVFDWTRAPANWDWYNPSLTDYQTPGSMKRTLFRCMPGAYDFETAFQRAANGETVVACTYTHTFAGSAQFNTNAALHELASQYPTVRFRYVGAKAAAQHALGYADTQAPNVTVTRNNDVFTVESNEPLFTYPYGARRTPEGDTVRVLPQNLSPIADRTGVHWRYTFNLSGMPYTAFAVGGLDIAGNSFVTSQYAPVTTTPAAVSADASA